MYVITLTEMLQIVNNLGKKPSRNGSGIAHRMAYSIWYSGFVLAQLLFPGPFSPVDLVRGRDRLK